MSAQTTTTCTATVEAKNARTVEKASGVFVDAKFRGIQNLDFVDQALLSMIERFEKNGRTNVSYMANMVSQSRENISRRLRKLCDRELLVRTEQAKDRTLYQVTDLAKEQAANYERVQEEKFGDELKPAPPKASVHPVTQYHAPCDKKSHNKDNKDKSFVCVAGEASPAPTPSADKFIEHFSKDPVGQVFGLVILKELITGYFEHCSHKGTQPNLTGCRYRLEHQKGFRDQAEAKQRAAERLAAERLARISLEADKLETLNELWHMDNFNTMKANGLLINPDYRATSAETYDYSESWPQEEIA